MIVVVDYTILYTHINVLIPLAFDDHVVRLCLRIQFAPRRELTIHLNGLRKQFNGFIARGLYFEFYANNVYVLCRIQFSFAYSTLDFGAC